MSANVAGQVVRIVPTVPTLGLVLSDEERKDRLAYWMRDTMERRGLTPPKLAGRIGVSRSAVAAWVAGRSVPSMIYLGPLSSALAVDPRLFADLPAIPPSGAAEYLVEAAASGVEEGLRRALVQEHEARGRRAPSPRRQPRGTEAKSG